MGNPLGLRESNGGFQDEVDEVAKQTTDTQQKKARALRGEASRTSPTKWMGRN